MKIVGSYQGNLEGEKHQTHERIIAVSVPHYGNRKVSNLFLAGPYEDREDIGRQLGHHLEESYILVKPYHDALGFIMDAIFAVVEV